MLVPEKLWQCERGFWLDGAPHYAKHMSPDARMVFPEPAGILDAGQIMQGLEGAPRWEAVEFEARNAVRVNETIVLSYRAAGHRSDNAPYRVLCSSTYVLVQGEWTLLMHQHTPVG